MKPYSHYELTSLVTIASKTLTSANITYATTLSAGEVADLEIFAKGGEVRWSIGGTTTEAYRTIPQDSTWWWPVPFIMADETILYFWTPSAGTTVEVLYRYY